MTDPEIEQRIAFLTEGLKGAGVKLTLQRREVCREMVVGDAHPDAETVFNGVRARLPAISLDTVYRTLHTLLDLDLIGMLGSAPERMRFDGNTERHHHFVCTRCGEAHDFACEDFDHLPVPSHLSMIGAIQKSHVEIRGVCLSCSNPNDQQNPATRAGKEPTQ